MRFPASSVHSGAAPGSGRAERARARPPAPRRQRRQGLGGADLGSGQLDGAEVRARRDARVIEQDPLGVLALDRGMTDDDLQAEAVLHRDQPAGEPRRRAGELEGAARTTRLEDPLIEGYLAVEEAGAEG